jgi:hypothetical protein
MSKASEIAGELVARIATITKANGYATDIGTHTFRGKRRLDEEAHLPCVILVEGNDSPKTDDNLTSVGIEQAYLFESHDFCDPDNPNDKAHLMIADLKRAIFSGEPKHGLRLNGKVRALNYRGRVMGAREDGAGMVFAGIHITVFYTEDLTNP